MRTSRRCFGPLVFLLVVMVSGSRGEVVAVDAHPTRRLVKIRAAGGMGSQSREANLLLAPIIVPIEPEDTFSDDSIEWSEPDYVAEVATSWKTSDPITPWSFDEVNIQDAWAISKGDDGLTVCVIDSGADATHPDLQGAIGEGYDAISGQWGHVDTNGHGTMVVGVLTASQNNSLGIPGVLWNGHVDSCRFLGDDGRGYLSDAIACLKWCVVDRQARIVSNSWGTYGRSRALRDVMEYYAEAYGVIYVAAAGNEGIDNDDKSEAMYPASYNLSSILSVAATTRLGTLAPFSNYASRGESVDIAAPGVDIISTFPGNTYRSMSGTSFAVPLVTGTLGLMMSTMMSETDALPLLSASSLATILLDSSQTSPMLYGMVAGGRLLDAYTAVRSAASFAEDPVETGAEDDRTTQLHPILEHAPVVDASSLRDGSRYVQNLRFPGDAVLNESALTDVIFADCPSSRYPRYDIQGLLGDVLIPKHVFAIDKTDELSDHFRYLQVDTCGMSAVFDSILVVLDCERGDRLHKCQCLRSNDGCKRRRAGSKVRAKLSAGHVYVAVVFASDPVEAGTYRLRIAPKKKR